MRLPLLGDVDCGCDDRKFIMFEAGKLGLMHGAVIASVALLIVVIWRVNNG